MIISIASGKGGTGKTTVAVNLAISIENVQFLDCDVEEPNAHLFLKPELQKKDKAYIPVPEVDFEKCTFCGKCAEICEYHALAVLPPKENRKGNVLIFPHLCHGCGACLFLCPAKAIKEGKREIGEVETGNRDSMNFTLGRLNVGEAMSPPLIREVKKNIDPDRIVIIDAPPGTSCPVITAVKGSDFCVLVTEPTPFGLNDLILAVEVLRKMKIPFGVVINRFDVGDEKVKEYCKREAIQVLMEIPFRKDFAHCYSNGNLIADQFPEYRGKFQDLFKSIKCLIEIKTPASDENGGRV